MIKAFISYSHNDSSMLEVLHKHLTQLQRDGLISTWTDNQITAGDELQKRISQALSNSNLFLALLSPDYIASNYCYETEFKKALEMQESGNLVIVPIIIEPCDWMNTPFQKFKALPKDGKPISTWENTNTAFLDITQNLRRLLNNEVHVDNSTAKTTAQSKLPSRNYRVQRDFDSIEKMEFVEKSFLEIVQHLKRFIEEVVQIDNVKSRSLTEQSDVFECLLVNRNKIASEARLRVEINNPNSRHVSIGDTTKMISYSIKGNSSNKEANFSLSLDEYHLFWSDSSYHSYGNKKELSPKEMSDIIWEEWLGSVGIM